MSFSLLSDEAGQPTTDNNGNYLVYNSADQQILSLPLEDVMNLGLICIQTDTGSEPVDDQPCEDSASGVKQQATWKDDNAVKALIFHWKSHEEKFKSTLIRNDKVWEMIAAALKSENPSWIYSGKQCENKFKDIRKVYTKTKDSNIKQSGQALKTCKFYEELDDVLGETPIIKPVAIASSSRKHFLNAEDDEPALPLSVLPPHSTTPASESHTKKSRLCRDLEKWAESQKEASDRRQEESRKRHEEKLKLLDRAVTAFETAMEKLVQKL